MLFLSRQTQSSTTMGSAASKKTKPSSAREIASNSNPQRQAMADKACYTNGEFQNEVIAVKNDLLANKTRSDTEYWFIRVLDRVLKSLRYPYDTPTELMPSCTTQVDVGFSKLHSLHQDPNKVAFPLPGDISPDELRDFGVLSGEWPTSDKDTNLKSQKEHDFTRWSSDNPMSKYYNRPDGPCEQTLGMRSPCPADQNNLRNFEKSLRAGLRTSTSIYVPVTGEAAWMVFEPGLVHREVMTPGQTLTWEKRQNRGRVTERGMARRRRQIAQYFVKTYRYSEQLMEPFLGFAERMKKNAQQLEALC